MEKERLNKVVVEEEEENTNKDRATMKKKQEKKDETKRKEDNQENNGHRKEGDKKSMKVKEKRKKKAEEEKQEEKGSKIKKQKKQEVAEQNESVKDVNIYPQFFKAIFPKKPVEKLRIPQAFGKFLENEPLGVVSLKGPSGNTWHAKLVLDSEGFYFTHGWNTFFIDHNINIGEFLVFSYNGHSQFSIKVFDLTACEKKSAFIACPSKDATKKCEKGLMGIDAAKISHCPHEDYKGHNTEDGLQEDVDHVSNYVANTLENLDKGESMDVGDTLNLQHGERQNMDIDKHDASDTSAFPSGFEKNRKLDILKEFSGSSQRVNDRLSIASFDNRRKDSKGTTSRKSNRVPSCDKSMKDVPRKGSLRMNAKNVSLFQNSARM